MSRPMRVLLMLTLSAGFASAQQPERGPDPAPEPLPGFLKREPKKVAESDSPLLKLQKERCNVTLAAAQVHYERLVAGRESLDEFAHSVQRLYAAELDLLDKPAERIALMEKRVQLYKEVEQRAGALYQGGAISRTDFDERRLLRIEAEIALLKEKQK